MKIGVIAIQGDVAEHIVALEQALAERREKGEVAEIKHRGIVGSCDAIVIPGGESTTIGRLMEREGILPEIKMSIFEEAFHAVFIRAPAITRAAENVEVLATFNEHIVAAKQGNIIALSFHPELTEDQRFHHYFLDLCK